MDKHMCVRSHITFGSKHANQGSGRGNRAFNHRINRHLATLDIVNRIQCGKHTTSIGVDMKINGDFLQVHLALHLCTIDLHLANGLDEIMHTIPVDFRVKKDMVFLGSDRGLGVKNRPF